MEEPIGKRSPVRRRRRSRGRPHDADAEARPVPLWKRTASHFEPGDRDRGAEYFVEGRVQLEVAGSRARGRVEGKERDAYAVGVDWTQVGERVLHTFCSCERFAGGRPCKHLWATLLALAESGPENQPAGKDRLSLRKDRAGSWPDLGVAAEPERPERLRPARRARAHLARPARLRPGVERGLHGAGGAAWRALLAAAREEIARAPVAAPPPGVVAAELRLLIDTTASQGAGGLILDIFERAPAADGEAGKLRRSAVKAARLQELLGAGEPVAVVTALSVEQPLRQSRPRRSGPPSSSTWIERFRLPAEMHDRVLPRLCAQGALGWWDGRVVVDRPPLAWDAGEAWRLALRLEPTLAGAARLRGALERNGQSVSLGAPVLVLPGEGSDGAATGSGLVLFVESLGRLEAAPSRDRPWLEALREAGEIPIPRPDLEEALTALLELPTLPRLDAPEELRLSEEQEPLQPRLVLEPEAAPGWTNAPLLAELSFRYGEVEVKAEDPRGALVDWELHKFVRRDLPREHAAVVRLVEVGLKPLASANGHELSVAPRDLAAVAEPLLAEGWAIEVHGTTLRRAGPPALRIESGIDWFELSGGVDFAGGRLEMKELLDAVLRGERFVKLEDGSRGLLPAAWLETYDSLAKLAHDTTEEGLRFLHSQALLVDALLAAMPPAQVDSAFAELREKLSSFERIEPKKEPRGFVGTLRAYQRHGLGWLEFVREYGLGGVLADDMGLGKTVQVLALLQGIRNATKNGQLPSLVVAPKSLVYNWIDEAARFTPKLTVLEYGGPDREALRSEIARYDLVVTTYGTLRNDIGWLATVEFDTAILDEAQAIKNAASQSAKASRLLVARHRLALTGTPIENHLGELGSLFEFLNPGLLGRLPRLDVLTAGRAPTAQELSLVAEGMRPFILRRTKAQVLADLPPKTEQVLLCTLGERQRELYDALRARYQASLLQQVEKEGLGASTIQVLEALLRLRQVACHPGLVDESWAEAGSAKLDTLFEQVAEVLDEGHKVLVFSQFTSLLAYVRGKLDEQGTAYAYLDGQTRDRGAVVERFQTDPDCNLFLISLKAGGLGLNLTAAGYVFLLDPWWNPAVEAQAIDRAHRIGQTQPVFAYRLIARDTVEEKILDLQRSKKQLADAILEGETDAPLRELTAEDLRMLLG
jgi:superfamily II DNA or RNA helicase